jgi:3-deoxy-D-manno-octulosonic-acid transferase
MGPPSLHAYRVLTALGTPLAAPLLAFRLRRGKEDGERLGERRGRARLARPPGRLVWLHGASVGEAVSLLPFVERIARAGATALVTTGTVTSAGLIARRLPAGRCTSMRRSTTRSFFAAFCSTGGRTPRSSPSPNCGRT